MKPTTTMKAFIAFLFLAGAGLMGSCIPGEGVKGDGNVVKEERTVKDFSVLEVSSAFKVFLRQGSSVSLAVEADQNLMAMIKTEVKGNTLRIYTTDNIKSAEELNIYLSFKELEAIDISGAVDLEGEGLMTFGELNLDCSGASELQLSLNAEKIDASISGASHIALSGEVPLTVFDMSGASKINAFDLVVKTCELDVSGAAEARVNASESLKVDVSGAAAVRYKGSPKILSDISGAGSLKAE